MRNLFGILVSALVCVGVAHAAPNALTDLDPEQQQARLASDLKVVRIYRDGLAAATRFAHRQTNLFPEVKATEPRLPRREEKEVLWETWKSYLDYQLALDVLERQHRDFFRLESESRRQSFLIGYAAFLAKYRFGMAFIARAENNPLLDTILDEPVPELGLPAGTYARLKFRYLNVLTAADFAVRTALYPVMKEGGPEPLLKGIEADTEFIVEMGRGRGEALTARNALRILQDAGESAWFPVQAGVAEWMGDTKVYRVGQSLISQDQLHELRPRLLPGDVLLVRHEWYLSNVGLPGFWPHAALYVGTPQERRAFFADPEVAEWVRDQGEASGELERLLQDRSPAAHATSREPQEEGHAPRVLEAISEGVSFTTLEYAADADSLAVLRPLLPKAEKAAALLRAFHYAGRPYDFNFDFATDAELVCTELVYKAYEPTRGHKGLRLPLVEMLGRLVTPANEIARQFDSSFGTSEAQLELVTFLDGHERGRRAVAATPEEFRQSWRRPKWHVLTQEPL